MYRRLFIPYNDTNFIPQTGEPVIMSLQGLMYAMVSNLASQVTLFQKWQARNIFPIEKSDMINRIRILAGDNLGMIEIKQGKEWIASAFCNQGFKVDVNDPFIKFNPREWFVDDPDKSFLAVLVIEFSQDGDSMLDPDLKEWTAPHAVSDLYNIATGSTDFCYFINQFGKMVFKFYNAVPAGEAWHPINLADAVFIKQCSDPKATWFTNTMNHNTPPDYETHIIEQLVGHPTLVNTCIGVIQTDQVIELPRGLYKLHYENNSGGAYTHLYMITRSTF